MFNEDLPSEISYRSVIPFTNYSSNKEICEDRCLLMKFDNISIRHSSLLGTNENQTERRSAAAQTKMFAYQALPRDAERNEAERVFGHRIQEYVAHIGDCCGVPFVFSVCSAV